MSGFWSEEQQALRAATAAFVEREVVPHLQDWEDAGEIPRSLHQAAAKAGLLGVSFPEPVGGQGGTLLDSVAMQEAFFEAGGSSGLAAGLFTAGIALPHIVAAGDPRQIEEYVAPVLAGDKIGSLAITEPGGGSDVAGITTRAVRDGDSYVVNGAKTFITSGVRADFVTTAVRTGGSNGSGGGHAGVSLLVIEKGSPGFVVDRDLRKMGWHCSDTAELSFTDVRVPLANLVGEENAGFYARSPSSSWSSGSGWRCTPTRSRPARSPSPRRTPRSGRRSASRSPPARWCGTSWSRCTARSRWRGPTHERSLERHVAGESVIAEACLAKQTACDTATYVCHEAVQLFGGAGYLHGTEVERHYRDARILPIGGGATEVLTDLAARLLGYAS